MTPDDFAGAWRIDRLIEDRAAGQEARFEGEGRFVPKGPGRLDYAETGVLRLGAGPPMQASRAYAWLFEGREVAVLFDDGRPFHRFDLSGAAQAEHWCDPDTYRVAYDFSAWPVWRAVWDVCGPRKDYRMTSTYSRP